MEKTIYVNRPASRTWNRLGVNEAAVRWDTDAETLRSHAHVTAVSGDHARRRIEAADGSYTIVFLGVPGSDMEVELTSLQDHPGPYALGDNEQHIGFRVDDFNAAHALHERMGCICYENPAMGIYFIEDPDGYWLEIIPTRD